MANQIKKSAPKSVPQVLAGLNNDMKALNSSVLIISQKMKHLARNEKILGRNLIVLNKKIASLKEAQKEPKENENPIDNEKIEELEEMVHQLTLDFQELKTQFVEKSEIEELKYYLDTVNPLQLVTRKDVEKILSKKLSGELD